MKISELIAARAEALSKDPSTILPAMAFGIEVDKGFEDFDAPTGLAEIGFLTTFEDDGDISDDVLQLAISYSMPPSKVSVMLEIPAEANIGNIRHTVYTIEAINAGASFLPPEELDDASFEAYCERIEAVTEVWCQNVNFANTLLPVSSYFQHMVVELINPEYAATFVPNDEYIVSRFHAKVPVWRSDILKARIRAVVRNAFTDDEGVDRFPELMLGICAKAMGQVEFGTAELARLQAEAAADEDAQVDEKQRETV